MRSVLKLHVCTIHIFTALLPFTFGVKVNMRGTLNFGNDVLETFSLLMRRNNEDLRTSTPFSAELDTLYLLTKSTYICHELSFCEGKLETFLNEYITLLTKAIEAALKFIMEEDLNETKTAKHHVFKNELKNLLPKIRKLLIDMNMRVTDKNAHLLWRNLIKTICAMFQEEAIEYSKVKLGEDTNIVRQIIKQLTQKFVIATVTVENVYERKLCIDHNICTKSHECTKALRILFEDLKSLKQEKTKSFIKYFSQALRETNFYSYLNDTTANQFQIILDEMVYTDSVSIQNLFLALYEILDHRWNCIKTNTYFTGNKNVELVHMILSDMDYFYGGRKVDPFHIFLSNFFEWVRLDNKLKQPILELMEEITVQVYEAPELLRMKLIREVRVFLELTVDPE